MGWLASSLRIPPQHRSSTKCWDKYTLSPHEWWQLCCGHDAWNKAGGQQTSDWSKMLAWSSTVDVSATINKLITFRRHVSRRDRTGHQVCAGTHSAIKGWSNRWTDHKVYWRRTRTSMTLTLSQRQMKARSPTPTSMAWWLSVSWWHQWCQCPPSLQQQSWHLPTTPRTRRS